MSTVHLDVRPQPWADDALCTQVDPELFFPETAIGNRAAKRICAKCDAITECLEFALRNNEKYGIFGGLTEHERRRVKKARRAVA